MERVLHRLLRVAINQDSFMRVGSASSVWSPSWPSLAVVEHLPNETNFLRELSCALVFIILFRAIYPYACICTRTPRVYGRGENVLCSQRNQFTDSKNTIITVYVRVPYVSAVLISNRMVFDAHRLQFNARHDYYVEPPTGVDVFIWIEQKSDF